MRRLWCVPSPYSVKATRWWTAKMTNEATVGASSVVTWRCCCWLENSNTSMPTWQSVSLLMRSTSQKPWRRRMSGTTENLGKTSNTLYLHVGPSGDCWTGDSIFAAKHLQPDYVKSIPLPVNNNVTDEDGLQQQKIDCLLEVLEDDQDLTASIYDTESIPSDLLERIF